MYAASPLLKTPSEAGHRKGCSIYLFARTNSEPAKIVQNGETSEISVALLQEGESRAVASCPHGDIIIMATDGAGQIEDQTGTRSLEAGQLVMISRGLPAQIVAQTQMRLIVILPKPAPRAALSAVRA